MVSLSLILVFIILTISLISNLDGKLTENEETTDNNEEKDEDKMYESNPEQIEGNFYMYVEIEIDAIKEVIYQRHKECLRAAKEWLTEKDSRILYEKLDSIFDTILKDLSERFVILDNSSYVPGQYWPFNTTVFHAMASIVEDTLYFGELVLSLPVVSKYILEEKIGWEQLIMKGVTFSQQNLPYLHENLHLPLKLMAQELGFIEKDDNVIDNSSQLSILDNWRESVMLVSDLFYTAILVYIFFDLIYRYYYLPFMPLGSLLIILYFYSCIN